MLIVVIARVLTVTVAVVTLILRVMAVAVVTVRVDSESSEGGGDSNNSDNNKSSESDNNIDSGSCITMIITLVDLTVGSMVEKKAEMSVVELVGWRVCNLAESRVDCLAVSSVES
jgi:hypothetical protein